MDTFDIILLIALCFGSITLSSWIANFIAFFIEIAYDFSSREKKQEAPGKVYRQKSQFIQKLLSEGKAKKISPAFFIEDHTFNGSQLLFKSHDEKCQFLLICDLIEYQDGFITDFEVKQIALTKKLVANN
jgi:hypothetical protein